jgi:RNA polymerase-binding protein
MILHLQIAAGAIPPTGHVASYWCAKGHQTRRWWSTDVTAPELCECRCGLPAGRDRAHPPEPRTWRPFKSPLAHLLERRSEAECEALLDEALQRLRVRRGRGHPPHTWNRGHDRAHGAPEHVDGPDSGSRHTLRRHRR